MNPPRKGTDAIIKSNNIGVYSMNISKTGMKVIFIIVLLLILLPLALFVLVQFAPPKEAPAQDETGIADSTETRRTAVRTRQPRRENRAAKQETVSKSKSSLNQSTQPLIVAAITLPST